MRPIYNKIMQGGWLRASKQERLHLSGSCGPFSGAFLNASPAPASESGSYCPTRILNATLAEAVRHRVLLPYPEQVVHSPQVGFAVGPCVKCHLCGDAHDAFHEANCSGTTMASNVHNRLRDAVASLLRRASPAGTTVNSEPDLGTLFQRKEGQSASGISNNSIRFRSDVSAVGPDFRTMVEVKVFSVAAQGVALKVPDSFVIAGQGTMSPEARSQAISAASRLNPLPASCPTNFLPGVEPFFVDTSPAMHLGTLRSLARQYFDRWHIADPGSLFLVAFDTAAGISPRANQLRRRLCLQLCERKLEEGEVPEHWFEYYRQNSELLSTILNRGLAERRIHCRRTARLHHSGVSRVEGERPPLFCKGKAGAAERRFRELSAVSAATAGALLSPSSTGQALSVAAAVVRANHLYADGGSFGDVDED